MQAVGFMGAEFGNFNVWFPNSSIEPAAASGTGYYPADRQQVAVGNADLQFAGSSCEFADLGRSNLWRPMVVDRIGGSKWVQALPIGQRPVTNLRRSPQIRRN